MVFFFTNILKDTFRYLMCFLVKWICKNNFLQCWLSWHLLHKQLCWNFSTLDCKYCEIILLEILSSPTNVVPKASRKMLLKFTPEELEKVMRLWVCLANVGHRRAKASSPFHQHFTSSFCTNILLSKNLQSQTVIREKLHKHFGTKKLHI